MEKKEDENSLHLIRNDNGEWISDENAVILSKFWVKMLKSIAAKKGKELHIQHGPDDIMWCYRREWEEYAINYNKKQYDKTVK
ncbi:MAG: hypothetical protein J6W38_08760 [Prevotella sp.]|nr:hypothetical protein [Prevotella sp.]